MLLKEKSVAFNQRFASVFNLASKSLSAQQIQFAKEAFSNLLGGIGYFAGKSLQAFFFLLFLLLLFTLSFME